MVMGYFTCKHFMHKDGGGKASQNAIVYTLNKFISYMPYVLVAVVIEYVYEALPLLEQGLKPFLKCFKEMPLELLLLSDSIVGGSMHVVPLWFLSSAFIIFPWFCCIMQMKDKYMLALISWTVPVMYYGYIGVSGEHTYPVNLLRVFAGLMLGAFIYFVSIKISGLKNVSYKMVFWMSLIEGVSFLFVLMSIFKNWQFQRWSLMAFTVGNILMFSGTTLSSRIKAKWIILLRKISMPMYIVHWSVITVINYYFADKSYMHNVIIFYIATFSIALLSNIILKYLKIEVLKIFRLSRYGENI